MSTRIAQISEGGPFQPYARYYVEGNDLMLTFGDGSKVTRTRQLPLG